MECIIAYRVNGGRVRMVMDEEDEIAIFPHEGKAIAYAYANALFRSGQADHQIIELDDL